MLTKRVEALPNLLPDDKYYISFIVLNTIDVSMLIILTTSGTLKIHSDDNNNINKIF